MTDDLHTRLAVLEDENARLRERNEYVEEMYDVLMSELALAKAALQIWEHVAAEKGFTREEKETWN